MFKSDINDYIVKCSKDHENQTISVINQLEQLILKIIIRITLQILQKQNILYRLDTIYLSYFN